MLDLHEQLLLVCDAETPTTTANYHDNDSGKTQNLDDQAFLRTTTQTAEEGEEE